MYSTNCRSCEKRCCCESAILQVLAVQLILSTGLPSTNLSCFSYYCRPASCKAFAQLSLLIMFTPMPPIGRNENKTLFLARLSTSANHAFWPSSNHDVDKTCFPKHHHQLQQLLPDCGCNDSSRRGQPFSSVVPGGPSRLHPSKKDKLPK